MGAITPPVKYPKSSESFVSTKNFLDKKKKKVKPEQVTLPFDIERW